MTPVVNQILNILTNSPRGLYDDPFSNLFIVTLESKEGFNQSTGENSTSEAERVYKTQEQLASTVSALIDFLPRVLHPKTPEIINTWVVAGIGLGAHAAWMAMDRDPRLHACIPILGSPDFLDITTSRSLTHFPLLSSFMTHETREYILKHDPISRPASPERPNPFLNKRILAIVGAQDSIASTLPTRKFLDRINVGPLGTKKLIIQEGVGHQCTLDMIIQMAEFIWDVALT